MSRRRGRSSRLSRRTDPAIGREIDVQVERIGSSGDGIGKISMVGQESGQPQSKLCNREQNGVEAGGSSCASTYVPLALPGDRLTVRLKTRRGRGYVAETVGAKTLARRSEPVCRHFGRCGGCRLQHVPAPDYRRWKISQIEAALASRGIENVRIRPLIDGDLAARRRLRLAFAGKGEGLVLGFRRRSGRDVVAIDQCPIARPEIVQLFKPLKSCLTKLDMTAKGGELSITALGNGLDLLIDAPVAPRLVDREALAALAVAQDLARLAWRPNAATLPEPIAARRQPIVDFGGIAVPLPAGAFLQATEQAESAIRQAVGEAIGNAAVIADLFAGAGALSLPFAGEGRRIHAFERDPAMIQALTSAAASAGLAGRVEAISRDLEQTPLTPDQLRHFDALIIDPPRAGAKTQMEAIAASGPRTIAMVSCNPATFARDARTLIDAGHRLRWIQPIDAFLYAAEIELIAAFEPAIPP